MSVSVALLRPGKAEAVKAVRCNCTVRLPLVAKLCTSATLTLVEVWPEANTSTLVTPV